MQKDYWSISKSNFRALGVITLISIVLVGLTVFNVPVSPERSDVFITLILLVVSCAVLFVVGSLFKKHSPKAITIAYIYLGLGLISSVVRNFFLNPPAEGIIFKILQLLVIYYVFINVYKASKQTPVIAQ